MNPAPCDFQVCTHGVPSELLCPSVPTPAPLGAPHAGSLGEAAPTPSLGEAALGTEGQLSHSCCSDLDFKPRLSCHFLSWSDLSPPGSFSPGFRCPAKSIFLILLGERTRGKGAETAAGGTLVRHKVELPNCGNCNKHTWAGGGSEVMESPPLSSVKNRAGSHQPGWGAGVQAG